MIEALIALAVLLPIIFLRIPIAFRDGNRRRCGVWAGDRLATGDGVDRTDRTRHC